MSEVKVNQVQVTNTEDGKTFAVCLDQDEKRFIQGVTRQGNSFIQYLSILRLSREIKIHDDERKGRNI